MSYVPDIVTPFCVSAIKTHADLTKMVVEKTWRNMIFNEEVELDYDKFALPFSSLRSNVKSIAALEDGINEAFQFFNQYPNLDLDKCKAYTLLMHDTSEIINISPKYITERFPKRLESDISDLLAGKTTISKLQEIYDDPIKRNDISRGFYGSTLPDYITLKHLANLQCAEEFMVSKTTIQRTVLPFLMEVTDVKLHGSKTKMSGGFKRASFMDIIETTEQSFTQLVDEIDILEISTDKAISMTSGIATKNQLMLLFASIRLLVYNIETRLVALLLRMIRAYTANIRAILELKSVLSWKDGLSSKAFTEDYDDEERGNVTNLSMTNSAGMVQTIDELIGCIQNCTTIDADEVDALVEKYTKSNPYLMKQLGRTTLVDTVMYDETYTELVRVKTATERLFDSITKSDITPGADEDEVIFAEALSSCDLADAASINFSKIMRGRYCPTPHYLNPLPMLLVTDLSICRKAIIEIANTIKGFVGFLSDMSESLSKNPNGMYRTDTFVAKSWVLDMIDALGRFNEDLAIDYRKRIVGIANLINVPNRYSTHTVVIDKSYITQPTDTPECLCAYEESAADNDIAAMNRHYMQLYKKKLRGEVFLEENEGQNGNNQSGSGNGTPSGGSDNNAKQGTSGTKPVVRDNAANNQQNNQNNTDKSQDGKDDSSGGKVTDKIRAMVNRVIESVKKIFANGSKKKNLDWLAKNKGFLLSRNYVNTSVDILPYQKDGNYINMVGKCIDKAAAINEGTLKTTDENGLRATIFGGIKMPKTDEGLEADLVRGFKVGTAELKTVQVADNELKAMIPSMIQYCENYYNNTESALDGLQKKIDSLKILDERQGGSGEDQKTKDNAAMIGTQLATAIKAARIASKDRCNDYLLILDALAAPNKNANGKNDGTQAENNQGNQNNNN